MVKQAMAFGGSWFFGLSWNHALTRSRSCKFMAELQWFVFPGWHSSASAPRQCYHWKCMLVELMSNVVMKQVMPLSQSAALRSLRRGLFDWSRRWRRVAIQLFEHWVKACLTVWCFCPCRLSSHLLRCVFLICILNLTHSRFWCFWILSPYLLDIVHCVQFPFGLNSSLSLAPVSLNKTG